MKRIFNGKFILNGTFCQEDTEWKEALFYTTINTAFWDRVHE